MSVNVLVPPPCCAPSCSPSWRIRARYSGRFAGLVITVRRFFLFIAISGSLHFLLQLVLLLKLLLFSLYRARPALQMLLQPSFKSNHRHCTLDLLRYFIPVLHHSLREKLPADFKPGRLWPDVEGVRCLPRCSLPGAGHIEPGGPVHVVLASHHLVSLQHVQVLPSLFQS